MILNQEKRSMALADLVVAPHLKGFDSDDFKRAPELAQRGYEGAAKKAFLLEKLSIPPPLWEEHLRERATRRRTDTLEPKFVEVKGAAPGRDRKLREDLQNLAGVPVERSRVERRLNHIVGEGRYASAHYDFERRGEEAGLVVHFQQKAHAPPSLNTLLLIDGASGQPFRFGAASRLTFLDVGGPGSEWRTDLSVGGFNQALSEYYWRVGGSRFFLAPRGFVQLSPIDIYERRRRLATLDAQERGAGVDAGFAASHLTEIRVGYEWNHVQTSVATGTIRPPLLNGNFSSVRARVAYEGQDSASVPRRGFRATSQFQWVLDSPTVGKEGYAVFQGVLSYAKPITARIHFTSSVEAGTKGNRAELYPPFTLGGVLRLSALARHQLAGNHYYLGGVGVFRSLSQTIPRFGKLYAGGLYELGNAWLDGGSAKPYHSGAAGVLGETFVGVMFLGGSVADKGERKVFFRLGRIF
jgi:NTE family protein